MFISARVSRFKPVPVLFLMLLCTTISASASDYTRRLPGLQKGIESKPTRGIRVVKVYEKSLAQKAGLQENDVVLKYGEHDVTDDASYFAARDAYEKSGEVSVEVVVWRGNERLTLRVPTGRLGMDSIEHNPVSYAFHSIMEKVNVMRDTPEYLRDRDFKYAAPPEKMLDEARRLIDRGAQDGTLTPNQVLVARIYLTSDNAPPEDLQRQAQMLAQLFSTQSDTYINFVGQTLFFAKKRYRAAIECFKEHLKVAPTDVNTRLNMGIALGHLGRFDESESAADYVLDNKLGLNQHGYVVAYQVKAIAALGHHDYQKSISFAERSFALNRTTFDLFLLQLAAAQNGDSEKLADAARKFEEARPDEYQQVKMQVDAITAYALVRNNQRDQARQLIAKWKVTDRIESRLSAYWGMYPGGLEIVKNWKELMPH